MFQIVARRTVDGDHLAIAFSALGRNLDGALTIEILSGERVGLEHLFRCSFEDLLTAFASRLRSDVDNPVGGAHHVLVVLDDDDGVALVA